MITEYENYITNHKPNGKVRESIFCHKCKNESGWMNSDLIKLNNNLNCKSCGKVCIKFVTHTTPVAIVDTKKKSKDELTENI